MHGQQWQYQRTILCLKFVSSDLVQLNLLAGVDAAVVDEVLHQNIPHRIATFLERVAHDYIAGFHGPLQAILLFLLHQTEKGPTDLMQFQMRGPGRIPRTPFTQDAEQDLEGKQNT